MTKQQQPVFFFDCDNCLYSAKLGVLPLMRQKIVDYFLSIGIPEKGVVELQRDYFVKYGLSIRGLQLHHNVDPVDFDEKVDQSLPLDGLITRDEPLREMIQKLNIKKWVFTNAYRPHAVRCLNLLGIASEFDGLTYTNYTIPGFNCKPEPESFIRAMKDAGVTDPSLCYLVDDSAKNIDAAKALGWTTIHLVEDGSVSDHGDFQITDIHDLPKVLPELWEEKLPEIKIKRRSSTAITVLS